MSNALVVRTQRHKKIGDAASPMVFTLKRKSKDAKIFDLERIAQDIEALGGMSAEDVVHVVSEFSTPPLNVAPPKWPRTVR